MSSDGQHLNFFACFFLLFGRMRFDALHLNLGENHRQEILQRSAAVFTLFKQ